jgi:uncharacterized membrane protein
VLNKVLKLFTITSLMVLIITFQNCSMVTDPENGAINSASVSQANLQAVQEAIKFDLRNKKDLILGAKCSSCYSNILVSGRPINILSTEELVANNLIRLGQPQSSVLYLDAVDQLIPSGSDKFTSSELKVISDWIAAEGNVFNTIIGGISADIGGTTVTFTQVRQVLTTNCNSCHGAISPRGGLRLDGDAATLRGTMYQGQPIILPRNAAGSRLYQSLSRMPTGGALGLNSQGGIIIRDWINGGAL